MISKGIIFLLYLVCVNCRYIWIDDSVDPVFLSRGLEHVRVRRQSQTAVSVDDKGNVAFAGKVPMGGTDENRLSATSSASWNVDRKLTSTGGGWALDNINGHGASISAKQIPDFGNQVTAAGRLNLLNSDKHNLDANAFISRNLPSSHDIPDYSIIGGNLDYMYNKKIGANLGVAHTDLLKQTDVSALGKLNLHRDSTSSFDFTGGVQRQACCNSRWQRY